MVVNVANVGTSQTSTLFGTVEPYGVVPGLTGTLGIVYNGVTNNGLTWNFGYTVDNTTSGTLTSEVSAFGFITAPSIASAGSTGLYDTALLDVQAGFLGNVDFCATAGNTCAGGGSNGISPSDPAATGTFSLTYANVLSQITLSGDFLRFQGITGTALIGGEVVTFNGASGFAQVPGPIVGAGMPGLIAACGGMWGFNFYRRRRDGNVPA